jgi:hypothetical protein
MTYLKSLNTISLLFLLYLFAASVYTAFSLSRALLGLRALRKRKAPEAPGIRERCIADLSVRLLNLRQFHWFSVLLFVCSFALQQRSVFSFMGLNKIPESILIIQAINIDANYVLLVFIVFIVFLNLHSLQWLVAGRLRSVARRVNHS